MRVRGMDGSNFPPPCACIDALGAHTSCKVQSMSKKLTNSRPHHRLRCKTAPPRIGGLPGKRGKAHGIGADLWAQWLEHVARCGLSWLHVLLFLTHALCLRVTEALCLRAEDFDFEGHVVIVRELTKQPAVAKPILQSLFPMLESLRANGVSVERSRNQGARGFVHIQIHRCTHAYLINRCLEGHFSVSDVLSLDFKNVVKVLGSKSLPSRSSAGFMLSKASSTRFAVSCWPVNTASAFSCATRQLFDPTRYDPDLRFTAKAFN